MEVFCKKIYRYSFYLISFRLKFLNKFDGNAFFIFNVKISDNVLMVSSIVEDFSFVLKTEEDVVAFLDFVSEKFLNKIKLCFIEYFDKKED